MNAEEALRILSALRGYVWHVTSVEGLRGIVQDERIRVNHGDLPNAYAQSKRSNCVEAGGVSLFDAITHSDMDWIGEDLLMLAKWPGVMFRHRIHSVFLGFRLEDLASNLLFYAELKRRFGSGGIIPRVEVCHVGDIPFRKVCRIGTCSDREPFGVTIHADVASLVNRLLS
jgi:hypothetical protein